MATAPRREAEGEGARSPPKYPAVATTDGTITSTSYILRPCGAQYTYQTARTRAAPRRIPFPNAGVTRHSRSRQRHAARAARMANDSQINTVRWYKPSVGIRAQVHAKTASVPRVERNDNTKDS